MFLKSLKKLLNGYYYALKFMQEGTPEYYKLVGKIELLEMLIKKLNSH
jgi:hypothetical protein